MIDRLRPRRSFDWRTPFDAVQEQHQALDILLAAYLVANPSKLPSTTSVLDLVTWSHARVELERQNPTRPVTDPPGWCQGCKSRKPT